MNTPKEYHVRGGTAMQIAQADRLKFNEAVSQGHFLCAPQTRAGSGRVFKLDDLIALFLFARLTELGLKPDRAGQLACQLKQESWKDEDHMFFIQTMHGSHHVLPGSVVLAGIRAGHKFKMGDFAFHIDFDIGEIRKALVQRIEAEPVVVGSDDE